MTSITAVLHCRNNPVGPNRFRKTAISVSPSRALKTSSSSAISHLANIARARAWDSQSVSRPLRYSLANGTHHPLSLPTGQVEAPASNLCLIPLREKVKIVVETAALNDTLIPQGITLSAVHAVDGLFDTSVWEPRALCAIGHPPGFQLD